MNILRGQVGSKENLTNEKKKKENKKKRTTLKLRVENQGGSMRL